MKLPTILTIFCIMVIFIPSCQTQSAATTSPSKIASSVSPPTVTGVPVIVATETATSIPAQIPLVASSESCAASNGSLPSLSSPELSSVIRPVKDTLGGGLVQSKEFTIELFLFCDSVFQPGASEAYFQSDIGGLAISYNWRYDASRESGLINVFFGIEPEIRWQTGEGPSASQGYISQGQLTGIHLPSTVVNDFPKPASLRFIYLLQTESGQLSGAALTFDIQQTSDGMRPGNVLVTALSDSDLESLKSTLPPVTP